MLFHWVPGPIPVNTAITPHLLAGHLSNFRMQFLSSLKIFCFELAWLFADPMHMGRARAILQSEYPYNITGRCINKEWFNLSLDFVWDIFSEELHMAHVLHDLVIHSFVLMNNHFHLIASTPKANISECMHRLLGNVSRRLNEAGNRINGNFSGRHFKTVLQHHNYYLNAYKYNYRNPVDVGICKNVEDYKYSTLSGLLGQNSFFIPVVEDTTLFSDVTGCLKWLNQKPDKIKQEATRYALKRKYFTSKKDPATNRLILSENDLL